MRVWSTNSLAFLGTCSMILQFLQGSVLAGPVRRSSRMIREVYPEIEPEKLEGNQAEVCIVGDVVYGAEEPVPADQPCLKCKCQPPGVQCETTRCAKKPGCRAIHKPNKCCPEYQCECDHEGRFYSNGERLETPPGGECRVCYCRGGEVQCAEVSCYIRTDCEGRTVPGQCCPKYDHCPPREPLIDRVVPYTTQSSLTSNAEHLDYWPSPNASIEEDRLTTVVYDLHEITNEDNNKITETRTEPTFSPKPTELETPNDTLEESNKIHIHEVKNEATQTDPLEAEDSNHTRDRSDKSTPRNDIPEFEHDHKITIQEIIPEIKEIPITGPPKREINLHFRGQNLNEDFELKIANNKVTEIETSNPTWLQEKETNVSDLTLGDSETDSSEISEIYHHPPPVLKIGDQLLFLKKGELIPGADISTPVPVITIIGAEGLQRGTEDSGEYHEVPSQVQDPHKDGVVSENPEHKKTTTERNGNTHIISLVKPKSRTEDTTKSSLSTIEDFLLNLTKAQPTAADDFYSESIDSNMSMLTETVINKIKALTNIESTTDVAHLVQKVYITDINSTDIEYGAENSSTIDPNIDVSTSDDKWYEVKTNEEQPLSTSAEPSTTLLERMESVIPTSTEEIEKEDNTTHSSNQSESRYEDLGESKLKHDDDVIAMDQNPEYPPIPDIMSPQNVDELSEHLDAELAQVSSEEPLIVEENNSTMVDAASNETTEGPNENSKELRLLPDLFTIRNNKTIQNRDYPNWLKNTTNIPPHPLINEKSALPTSLLQEVAPSDNQEVENTTEPQVSAKVIGDSKATQNQISEQANVSTEATSTDSDRSKETLEESTSEESGESTTAQNRHASILLSAEDASVETTHDSPELDMTDLVETIPGIHESTEESDNKSVEKRDKIPNISASIERDVELIDSQMLMNKTKENMTIKNVSNSNTKIKNVIEVESDDIFKQLNEELKTVPSHVIDNKTGNEDSEAEAIFRELLEEATSSTLPPSNDGESGFLQPREKESELLQRVSDAITKFQLKESKESLDTSILGILRDFFSSQYKNYDTEK